MSDILYESALYYSGLVDKGYNIVVGRKKKEYRINLRFPIISYFHLVGLQHLTDIKFPSTNKERIFKEILDKNMTYETIHKSIFFNEYNIEERILYLSRIEEMLDSCCFVFLINHQFYLKYTTIYADYLFEYSLPENTNDKLYLFTVKNSTPKIDNECVGCSFFKKKVVDYRNGTQYTVLLFNEKVYNVNKPTEFTQEIYLNPVYNKRP